MALTRGAVTNGAYKANLSGVGSGCHRYFFLFKDSADSVVTFPTTGSLGIGPAGSCADWDSSRPATGSGCDCVPQCSAGSCGDDGCGGSCGSCGDGATCGPGGFCLYADDAGPGGSGGGGGDGGVDNPGTGDGGGCCDTGSRGGGLTALWCALAIALMLARRRAD